MAGPETEHRLDWPFDQSLYLTLDFECDYGTALPVNTFDALDATDRLVSLLERLDVPLTCFVQTEVLDAKSEAVETLRNAGFDCSFHSHSHTHRRREVSDVREEIERSTQRFSDFFGRRPRGYRFPNGNVQASDYELLAECGYEFDASRFPTWRPGHFANIPSEVTPTYHPSVDLYDLPFTVYARALPIPTGLSYCRLFGRPFTALLTRWPPSTVVFNVHMHDLVNPSSYGSLSSWYRFVYGRNAAGLEWLEDILAAFGSRGYTFRQLDAAYAALAEG